MKRHSNSTLMRLTKKELVEYVRMAEHNQDVAEQALAQQAKNVKDWAPEAKAQWRGRQLVSTDDVVVDEFFICSRCFGSVDDIFSFGTAFRFCPWCGTEMEKVTPEDFPLLRKGPHSE